MVDGLEGHPVASNPALNAGKPDPCGAEQLTARARALRDLGDIQGAVAVLRDTCRRHARYLPAQLELASGLRLLNLADEAEAVYRAILDFSPNSGLALAGLGKMLAARGQHASALPALQRALEARPDDLAVRIDIADVLRHLHRPEDAAAMWRTVLEAKPAPAAAIRLRALIGLAKSQAALLRLDEADSAYSAALALDPANAAALAGRGQLANARHDHETARACFRLALEQRPDDSGLARQLVQTLVQLQRLDEAALVLGHVLETTPGSDMALQQMGQLCRMRGDDEAALGWFRKQAAGKPGDALALFEVYASLADLQRGVEAAAILASLNAMPGAVDDERLRLRRLEFCCRNLRFDAAHDLIRAYGGIGNMPPRAIGWTIAVHAGSEDWAAVLRIFAEHIVPSTGAALVPADDMLAEAVARAARALGRQAEVLRLLDTWQGARTPAGETLRDILLEEMLWLAAIGSHAVPLACALPGSELRAARSARVVAALNTAPAEPAGTILLCTDRAYLTGAVVALGSLLRHNSAALRHCVFRVVLAEDASALAAPILSRLAACYAVRIETQTAGSLGAPADGLRTSWGGFAGGHKLSEAAYWRILAALQLSEAGYQGRLLYIDSDTCIGSGLARLLQFDLASKPLGVRREPIGLPGIQRAARKLGVPADGYFNSGVMLIDMDHPDTVPGLRRSLEIAVTMPEKLSHLDQCALNLAFAGQTAWLPDNFNRFVRAKDAPCESYASSSVLHYLFRPKPWDPAYPTANNARWLDEFCALSEILTQEQLRSLMAVPFEVARPPACQRSAA